MRISSRNQSIILLRLFLAIVFLLLVIGTVFVYSASSVHALAHFNRSHYYLKRHTFGIILGLIVFCIVQCVPVSIVQRATPFLFFISLGLTTATLIPYCSHIIHGSRRWLTLFTLTFQPSELLKITLPLYIAHILEKNIRLHKQHDHCYFLLFFILISTSLVLLKQPDFGLTMTLLLATLIVLFIAQFKLKHISFFLGYLGIIGSILIAIRPYRIKRLLTFLNPWNDPQGAGFQIIQSLIAIGSGYWVGAGIAHSKQKFFYLPMQHTDFIFAIIAEETGFIGCFFLISLYIAFAYTGVALALQLPTFFSQLVTINYITLISLQAIINMAVTLGLIPTKGIGLPFISYGNTALICNIAMISIIAHFVYES